MAGDWRVVSLGELIEVKHGYAFKGEFFSETPTANVLLTPGNFAIGGGFKGDKFKYYDGPVPPEYVLSPGDILVTMTDLSRGIDTLGYPAKVPDVPGLTFLHNQRLGKLVPKSKDAYLGYVYYAMCDAPYRHVIVSAATGSTVRHTSPTRIQSYEFSLPPIAKQRAIANILGCLDDKIEMNRQTSETLESMARTLFKSWFIDYDPVRAKAEGRAPANIDAENAQLFPIEFTDSKLGPIPKGWSVRPLDALARFQNGLALQKFRPREGERRLPVVKIAQLRTGTAHGEEWARADIDPSCILNDGDVVFSWSGSLMVRVWSGGQAALNQHLFRVSSSTFPKSFFLGWILHHLPEFQRIASAKATTMGHIQRHHLSSALCVVPPECDIAKICAFLETILSRQIALALQTQTLTQLRDTLLPRLLSGALPIRDAEQFLP